MRQVICMLWILSGASFTDRINTWWRHQMETFSALLAICAGNSPVPGEAGEAGDLRLYRIHYDVTIMQKLAMRLEGV